MDADTAVRLGEAHEVAGELAAAEAHYRAALAATRGTGGVTERAVSVNLARLCATDGREFEALALAHVAANLAEQAGALWDWARARLQLATAFHGIEDYARVPAVLDQIAAILTTLDDAHASRMRLSLALQRARLAASLGDVERARAALRETHAASRAATGKPATDRIVWLVNVVALNTAGRFDEDEPWLEKAPPADGVVRRELECAEQRARCLLGLRPETDGLAAAAVFLAGLRDAPEGTVGSAWRLRAAIAIGGRLAELAASSHVTKEAWDLAGHALIIRVAEIDACIRSLPEVAAAGTEVFDLLTEYRARFRERHQHLLREVAASQPWPPVDAVAVDRHGLVVACAWCTRVRAADGHWVPIRQFIPQEGERFTLSHGICALCWERSAREIEVHARTARQSRRR